MTILKLWTTYKKVDLEDTRGEFNRLYYDISTKELVIGPGREPALTFLIGGQRAHTVELNSNNFSINEIADGIIEISLLNSSSGAIVSNTEPSDPSEGSLWFNPTNSTLYIYVGVQWEPITAGGDPLIPSDGTINYNQDGLIESIEKGTKTTTFIRDVNNNIISVDKDLYRQDFIRDVTGKITGWTIFAK